jgi:hypothetical protein
MAKKENVVHLKEVIEPVTVSFTVAFMPERLGSVILILDWCT